MTQQLHTKRVRTADPRIVDWSSIDEKILPQVMPNWIPTIAAPTMTSLISSMTELSTSNHTLADVFKLVCGIPASADVDINRKMADAGFRAVALAELFQIAYKYHQLHKEVFDLFQWDMEERVWRRYYAINHDPISDRIRLTSNQKFDLQDHRTEIPRNEFRRIVRDIFRVQLPGLVHHLWCQKYQKPALPGRTSQEKDQIRKDRKQHWLCLEKMIEKTLSNLKQTKNIALKVVTKELAMSVYRSMCQKPGDLIVRPIIFLSAQVNKEEMMLRDNWWTEKEKESEKYKRLRKVSPDWTMSKIRSRTIMQTTPVILQLRSPNAITRTSPSVPSTPLVTKANARAQDTAQDQALMVNPGQEPRRGLAKEEATMRKTPNESGL